MSSQEHFNCIFCNESFDNKEDLQVHFRKHGDPKFDQNIKSKSKPQNECKTNNEDSKEDVEMVQCDVCSEVFTTISKAITHKHKLHPDHDGKYFCPWCGKLFTLKHLYKKHMLTNHNGEQKPEEIPFHCEGCNVDFYVPSAMVYHNKFFHRQETDLPAIGHSKKLILFNQEVMQIYYCPFCGEEFNNKVNLHKHMTDDHSDENQRPDEVLRCPLCDAVFYHLDAYELHLTFHTPDDLYSETNELMEGLTEFSLETVAPIVESVENADNSNENEDGTVGIEQFLQLAMEDSADSELNKSKKKHKKHKKSKKSKQDAITLDEFLNMNKDVFGEGIDFQGIEEVPTRIVKKQLKVKKPPQRSQSNSSTEIQKLRKQGIVIKMKGKPLGPSLKIAKVKCVDNHLKVAGTMVTHPKSTNDVLSKLMTQTNNQLKIVKKGNNDTNCEAFTPDENIDNEINSEHELLDIDKINNGEKSISESNIKSSGKDKPKTQTIKEDTVPPPQSPSMLYKKISSGHEGNSKVDKQLTVNVAENKLQSMLQDDASDSNHQNSPKTADYRKTQGDSKSGSSEKTINEIRKQQKDDSNQGQLNALRQLNSGLVIKTVNRANTSLTSPTEEVKYKEKINAPNADSSQNFMGTVKHLGNQITVKPSRPSNNGNDIKPMREFDDFDGDDYPEHFSDEDHIQNDSSNAANVAKQQATGNMNLNALHNLGKDISVKSQSQKRNAELTNFADNENKCNLKTSDNEKDTMSVAKTDNFIEEKTSKREAVINRLENISAKKISNTVIPLPPSTEVTKNKTVPKESPANILKHLTNITAKPLASKIHKSPNTVALGNSSIMKKPNNVKKEVRQDIEIYNIDDSDTDEDMTRIQNTNKIVKYATPSTLNKIGMNADEHKNTYLNLNEKLNDDEELFDEEYQSDEDEVQTIGNVNIRRITKVTTESQNKLNMKQPVVPQPVQNKSTGLYKTKIKPNSTNTHYPKVQNSVNYSPDYQKNDADSDNESLNGQVKIKEMNDHELSDVDSDMETSNKQESNVTVEYPEDSNSEQEHDNLDGFDEDFSDIESALKVNTLKKPDKVLPSNCEFLKNNKNITIKSLKEPTSSPQTSNTDNVVVKTLQNKNIADNQNTANKNIKMSVSGAINQMVAKQNMNTANKVNTVNKEVRVKTFQSQTVIEEITTTVTKTIRTVNQSHQEVRHSSETMSTPIRPQKMLQGIRPNMQIKNFPVTQLRHSAPPIGAKVRNCAPRMPTATNVKPGNYNQLVPVRPGVNLAGKAIRMANAKKEPQATNSRSPIGAKLKMAPNVRSAPVKRPIVEDVSNQGKIKKPNEFSVSGAGDPSEAAGQIITSSVNKSHFTSTSKVIRGNNVMTSTQVKSEASSQQHLTKLGNVAGLKIVKSSQVKQASLVEEKCEVNTPNRSTLEAIEKLQKHGLLVKKPYIDENEEADFSAEDFDYMEED